MPWTGLITHFTTHHRPEGVTWTQTVGVATFASTEPNAHCQRENHNGMTTDISLPLNPSRCCGLMRGALLMKDLLGDGFAARTVLCSVSGVTISIVRGSPGSTSTKLSLYVAAACGTETDAK